MKELNVHWVRRLTHANVSQDIADKTFTDDEMMQAPHQSLQQFAHQWRVLPNDVVRSPVYRLQLHNIRDGTQAVHAHSVFHLHESCVLVVGIYERSTRGDETERGLV